jgi:hypothetical protein
VGKPLSSSGATTLPSHEATAMSYVAVCRKAAAASF